MLDPKRITIYDYVIEDHSLKSFQAYKLRACPVCGGKHLDSVDVCPEKNQPITAAAAKRLAKSKYIAENIPDMKYLMRSLAAGLALFIISAVLISPLVSDILKNLQPDTRFNVVAAIFLLSFLPAYFIGVSLELKRKNKVLAEFEKQYEPRG